MKKFSRTPDIPKLGAIAKGSRRALNESMQLLFVRENARTDNKQRVVKLLNKYGSEAPNHSKSQTLVDRRIVFDHRSTPDKESAFNKTYSLNRTMLSNGTKTSTPFIPHDSSVSPNKQTNSYRATLSTIRKGQLPDSMIRVLAEYKGKFRKVEDFMVSVNCMMHEYKKAKFMVRGNMRAAGLCSKCAVKLAKDGYSVDEMKEENAEDSKQGQMEAFLAEVSRCIEKYDYMDKLRSIRANEYIKQAQKRLDLIDSLFTDLKVIIESKRLDWVTEVKVEAELVGLDAESYGRWIAENKSELNLMKNDIKTNYNQIIERVDNLKFQEIMNHFRQKLGEIRTCGNETSFQDLQTPESFDPKALLIQFESHLDRILTCYNKDTRNSATPRLIRTKNKQGHLLISQPGTLNHDTYESGVSIDLGKIEVNNTYFNYHTERSNNKSFKAISEALLFSDPTKQPGGLTQPQSYKHSL